MVISLEYLLQKIRVQTFHLLRLYRLKRKFSGYWGIG